MSNFVNHKMLHLWGGVAILVGSVIGAGILGIPYAVSKVGLGPGVVVLIALTTATVILNLMFAEFILRTKQDHQLPGYSRIYLGKPAAHVTLTIDLVAGYATQLAYMIGVGEVLSAVLGGQSFTWSIIIFLFVSVMVYKGLETIKRFEVVVTVFIFLIVFLLAATSVPHISMLNFTYWHIENMHIPYGVIMFALAGYNAIPPMRRLLVRKEKYIPHVIILAYVLVFIVYLTFMYIVLGVTGTETTQIGTIGLGQKVGPFMIVMGNVLALFTITTCYLSNGLTMRRTFQFDYNKSQLRSTVYALIIPLVFFLLGVRNFIGILGLAGGLILSIQSILIVITYWRAYKKGDREPEFTHGPQLLVGIVLLILFAVGALVTMLTR